MTFQTAAYAVDGNTESANFLRLMLQSATLGSQGVVGHLDCQVQANSPATSGIIITSGAVIVLGAESSYQGSYYGYNVGNDTTLNIAATGGSARSDMIVIRAEDPTWSGSPWGNPAAGQILFPRVISGVSSSAVLPPSGISAIPLARIDMPATTSVVQASYIHDLRQVCNPQRLLAELAQSGPGTPTKSTAGTTPVQWPTGASWQVQIPNFATKMVIAWTVNQVLWNNDGNGWVRIFISPNIGSSVGAPVVATSQALVSIPAATGPYRHTFGGSDTVSIPSSLRGTTQTLQFAQQATGAGTATLNWDEGSSVSVLIQFQQQAVPA